MDYNNMYSQDDSRFVSNSYIAYPYQGQNLNYSANNIVPTQITNPIRTQNKDTVQLRTQTPVISQIPNQIMSNQLPNQMMPNQPPNQIMSNQSPIQMVPNQSQNMPQQSGFDNTIAQNATMMNNQNVRDELISLPEAINLIKKSVGDEREDEIFYDSLIKSAPNAKAVEIITSIRNDERRHNSILRFVYYRLTGIILPTVENTSSTGNQDVLRTQSQNSALNLNTNSNTNSNSNQNSSSSNQMTSQTYKNNLAKALFGELDAVTKYRRIMGAMPDSQNYTLIMSIMTDELRHANKYNYLIHEAH